MWGSTHPSYLAKLSTLQNKAVKIVGGGKIFDRAAPFYTKRNIPKLQDLYTIEIAKLTYNFIHRPSLLPKMLSDIFIKATSVSQKKNRSSIHSTLSFQQIAKKSKVSRCQGLELDSARNYSSRSFSYKLKKTFRNTLLKSNNKKALKIEIRKSVVNYIFVKLSQLHVALYFPSPCSISRKITNSHGSCRLDDPKGPFAASKSTVFFFFIM